MNKVWCLKTWTLWCIDKPKDNFNLQNTPWPKLGTNYHSPHIIYSIASHKGYIMEMMFFSQYFEWVVISPTFLRVHNFFNRFQYFKGKVILFENHIPMTYETPYMEWITTLRMFEIRFLVLFHTCDLMCLNFGTLSQLIPIFMPWH